APAMDPTATTIAGTRLGGAVNLSARTQRTAAGTVSLAASAGVTTYPNQDAMQWAVSLRPSWAYDVAPLTARFSYDARFTNSGSPFGVSVDQVTPISRATGTVRLAGELERWEPFADWNADRPPELFGTLEFSGIRDQVALT